VREVRAGDYKGQSVRGESKDSGKVLWDLSPPFYTIHTFIVLNVKYRTKELSELDPITKMM
jgi:hypothetical protein